MNHFIFLIFFSFSGFVVFGQQFSNIDAKQLKKRIYKIKEVPYMPEFSGDPQFWKLVSKGKSMLPILIESIDDTSRMDVRVRFWGGNYAMGDMCFRLFQEIVANFQLECFILEKDPLYACQYGIGEAYWCFVRDHPANRIRLKNWLSEWYEAYADSLIWCRDTAVYARRETQPPPPVPDGVEEKKMKTVFWDRSPKYFSHPAGGFYLIKTHGYKEHIHMTGCVCEENK